MSTAFPGCCLASPELRKDKGARAPGGVTPGENPNYNAAVARADVESRDKSPVKDVKQRLRPPDKVKADQVRGGAGQAMNGRFFKSSSNIGQCWTVRVPVSVDISASLPSLLSPGSSSCSGGGGGSTALRLRR